MERFQQKEQNWKTLETNAEVIDKLKNLSNTELDEFLHDACDKKFELSLEIMIARQILLKNGLLLDELGIVRED